jgi:hypothetical protein
MGISAVAICRRRVLTASLGSGRWGGEFGRPIAMGRTGVAERRLIDKVVVQGRDDEHGHRRSRTGAAEVQHWNVAANRV